MSFLKRIVTSSLVFVMTVGVVLLQDGDAFKPQQVFAAGSNSVMIDFVGAYPDGLQATDIAQVPIVGDTDFYFALAFARDQEGSYPNYTNKYNGTFKPYWDTWSTYGLTEDRIQQLKNDNSQRKFLLSVGGDNYPWQDPINFDEWVNKAVSSLKDLITTYHLDGIDINYEKNLTTTFVNAWDSVLTQLKTWNSNLVVTVTPYKSIWKHYMNLYNKNSNNIDYINYQTYAETNNTEEALKIYDSLSNQVGGYSKLTLGLSTNPSNPEAMNLPDADATLQALMAKGVRGVQIWSVEYSAANNYAAEYKLQETLTKPSIQRQPNLAFGKVATQSTTAYGGDASRAVDGNTDGNWENNSVSHTDIEQGAWWQVDLGATCNIEYIEISNRTDCCMERLSYYNISIINKDGVVVWNQDFTGYPNPTTSLIVPDVGGQYVKIQLNETNYLSLAEVEVFGEENAAVGKNATQSSIAWQGDALRAVDGNTDGNWSNNSVTHTDIEQGAWWQVDLGAYYNIDKVQIYNRTDCCMDRLTDYKVSILNENGVEVWSTIEEGYPDPTKTLPVPNVAGQYVKIQLNGSNYLSLAEVQVFGK